MPLGPATSGSSGYNLGRELWPQKSIYDAILKESPFLGKAPKDTSFYEDIRHIAVGTGAPQGVGPIFTTAKGNKSASTAKQFAITAKTYYALFSIAGRLMRQAKGDQALIVKPYARESKNAITQWKRDISAFLFGNGGGAIGQISSTSNVSTNAITLADTAAVRFFDEGMVLTSSTADGTSGSIKSGKVTVTGVIRSGANKGRITVDQVWTTGIPTAAASDYLFREGVFGNVLNGLAAWIPSSDPSATLFNGVDRSSSPEKLAGYRIDGTNLTPTNAALTAAGAVHDSGGASDVYVLSTTDWQNLRNDLSAAGTLVMQASPAAGIGSYKPGMSYTAIKLQGPSGIIDVLADPDCKTGRGYMLMTETLKLASTGELVSLIEGPMMEDAADAWESRFVGDLDLICECPYYNATVQLTAGA
jgi:hypothetical protein